MAQAIVRHPISQAAWKRAVDNDPEYRDLLASPPDGWTVEDSTKLVRRTRWGTVTWVPADDPLRTQILALFHDLPTAGHFGKEKTLAAIRRKWEWPGLATDVADYVRTCATCQMTKPWKATTPGECLPIVSTTPWHTIVIDFLSGFPEARDTKHTDCLVAIDKFTKWVVAVPCRRNPTAAETAQLLTKGVFQTFGIPEVIISDRGPQFTSKTWEEIMRVMRVDNRLATPRHAQTSGQVERANSIIKRRLISAITADGSRWEEALPLATLAINCSVQRTTGTSPFQANFFREPRVPQTLAGSGYTPTRVTQRQVTDVLEAVRENVLSAADAMKQRQDRQRTGRTYQVGDKVWVSARVFAGQSGPPKLHCAFYGPYEVTQKINANAY